MHFILVVDVASFGGPASESEAGMNSGTLFPTRTKLALPETVQGIVI